MTAHPGFELSSGVRGLLHLGDPCEMPEFREFNFVYGANGSGKTTLAKCIAEAARDASLNVKIFDRDYVGRVLAEVEEVDALWVVADDASALVAMRRSLEEQLEERRSALKVSEAESAAARAEYDAYLERIADELRPLRRLATHGAATYPTTEVEEKIVAASERTDSSGVDRSQLRSVIEQSDLQSLNPFDIERRKGVLSQFLRFLQMADIGSLREVGLYSWATNAVALARSVEGEPCPFCSQVLTPAAIGHIESVAGAAQPEQEPYQAFSAAFGEVKSGSLRRSLPHPDSFDAPLRDAAASALKRFLSEMKALEVLLPGFDDAIALLADGSARYDVDQWIAAARNVDLAFAALVEVQRDHESAVEKQRLRKNEAFDQYDRSLIAVRHKQWVALRNTRDKMRVDQERGIKEIAGIESERRDITQSIRGLMSPERLNADLERYLGHTEIQFETNDLPGDALGYRIVRSRGEPADNLSEGERTAITLLHFLRDCGSADSANPPDVVILDDPVTSLDDSALYTAHAFIESSLRRDNGSDAPTVVVLTHRHPYFRLLVDWRRKLNREDVEANPRDRARLVETFSVLRAGEKECLIREMPDELATSGSEYALLFARLVEQASDDSFAKRCKGIAPADLATQPNLARRVLEGFLNFKYAGTKRPPARNLLSKALEDMPEGTLGADSEGRLWKLLNAASHGDALVETYEPIASVAEIRLVVKDVLNLIRELDPSHFAVFSGE